MIVRRIEVEGGFLGGLDLELARGLNVFIGPRGSGKTSVLELLRFGLDVPAMTEAGRDRARRQARAVLGGGRVTITVEVDGMHVRYQRNAVDDKPRVEGPPPVFDPLFVSQNELEAIGLDGDSRRRILDQVVGPTPVATREATATERARAILGHAEELRRRREGVLDALDRLAEVPRQLETAATDQTDTDETDTRILTLQASVELLSTQAAAAERRQSEERDAERMLRDWLSPVEELHRRDIEIESVPRDFRADVTRAVRSVHLALETARSLLESVSRQLEERAKVAADEAIDLQRRLRAQSQQLEELRSGSGERARHLATLRRLNEERNAALGALESLERRLVELEDVRNLALDELDEARTERYELRARAANRLAATFSNEVEVRVSKLGETAEYAAALGEVLQGSGMQYKALAQDLASRVSPRELIDAVERSDVEHLTKITGITQDRAERLVAHLRQVPTAPLLLCPLDDSIDFALLDGQKYKPTAELSMGQRCTVVLPLLLAEGRDLTVLDQPEDHLDNAFVVDTLVRSLNVRSMDMQVLIATHNANIPVLGDADRLIVLGSNGRRGYVDEEGELDNPKIVAEITNIMEGGTEAFAKRADFYAENTV